MLPYAKISLIKPLDYYGQNVPCLFFIYLSDFLADLK